ncbi:hypothetical protein Hdeb2414_s0020g00567511 [Helianthus debilis subsp. tardiflorus]
MMIRSPKTRFFLLFLCRLTYFGIHLSLVPLVDWFACSVFIGVKMMLNIILEMRRLFFGILRLENQLLSLYLMWVDMMK